MFAGIATVTLSNCYCEGAGVTVARHACARAMWICSCHDDCQLIGKHTLLLKNQQGGHVHQVTVVMASSTAAWRRQHHVMRLL